MAPPFGENGGITATTAYLMLPMIDNVTGIISVGILDVSNFNSDSLPSSVTFRSEDVIPGRVPTVRRVILTYRDMGLASVIVSILGVNDNNVAVSASSTVSIGNLVPTFLLMTKLVDVQLTAFRPQLQITRPANAGPVSIVSVVMLGTVERQSL